MQCCNKQCVLVVYSQLFLTALELKILIMSSFIKDGFVCADKLSWVQNNTGRQ